MLNDYIKISEKILKEVKILVFVKEKLLESLLREFFETHLTVKTEFFYEKATLLAHLSEGSSFYQIIVLALQGEIEEELEFLRQIKSFARDSKILAILNYTQNTDIACYFETGADDIIFKPFTFGELKARLIRLLQEYFLIEKLKKYIIEDPLTGVYNRRFFEDAIREESYRALRQKYPLTLFMIDLDKFKFYNDTFGHQAGDLLLKKAGQTFLESTRKGVDKVCRYGGDEFSIILPHIHWENSLVVVNRIFENWEKNRPKEVSLSIGVAELIKRETLEESVSFLINRADTALYDAKKKEGLSYEVDPESKKLTLA